MLVTGGSRIPICTAMDCIRSLQIAAMICAHIATVFARYAARRRQCLFCETLGPLDALSQIRIVQRVVGVRAGTCS